MARIQAGSTLVNQYAPPFVVSDFVDQGWTLQWNTTLQAFEAVDPNANVIEAGFSEINSALFPDVTQQVFVVPWAADSKESLIITIDGVKQQQDAYTVYIDTASNTTTVTLADTVSNETVEILGLQTEGGATVNVFGPQGVDSNLAGTVDAAFDIGWYAPSKESLIVTIDGVKQATSAYSITPTPGSSYTDTRLSFPNRAITFNTDTGVASGSDIITTDVAHGFVTGDGVYYGTGGGAADVQLVDGTLYYVRRLSDFTLTLHPTLVDANGNTNIIDVLADGLAETHSITLIAEPYLYINGNTISLNVAGTGYAAGDVISIDGGTPTTEALITVNTVGGGGEITSFTLSNAGEYVVFPASPATTSQVSSIVNPPNGTGVNATFNIQQVSPRIEVIGISTSGETPASPVTLTNSHGITPSTYGLVDNLNYKTVTNDTQVLALRSLEAGSNITIAAGTTDANTGITAWQINADVQRTFNQVGSGTSLFDGNDEDAEPTVFRRITGGDGIAISVVADTITVSYNFGYEDVIQGTDADPYVQLADERLLAVTSLAAAQEITLLNPSSLSTGETVTVKNQTASTAGITLTPAAGLIDGAANYVINTAYGYVTLYSDGSNYFIIAEG